MDNTFIYRSYWSVPIRRGLKADILPLLDHLPETDLQGVLLSGWDTNLLQTVHELVKA